MNDSDPFRELERAGSPRPDRTKTFVDTATHGDSSSQDRVTIPTGMQSLGDFRILREVGRGGMGTVFEAEQVSLRRRVALKVLPIGSVTGPTMIERFKREAETIADLHHPNIVPIYAVGSDHGVNYFAMQFVDGQSLAECIHRRGGPFEPRQVADWAIQVADALSHAHQHGVIHRDVKPSNLLLDANNRLWLTDFGLARRVDDLSLSMSDALLGTPRYMSPEQANLASRQQLDHRTDLFSLGATLYELLTGQAAFDGDTPHEVIQKIVEDDPIPIRQVIAAVPRDLETIVTKCLAKEPSERYATAKDLADDLQAFRDDRPIRARRVHAVERAGRWVRKQRRSVLLSGSGAAIALLLVVMATLAWLRYDDWRQASVRLETTNPPLVAEILDSSNLVVKTTTVPMQEGAEFPAGEYRVRASGSGTLSQTFEVTLHRGKELTSTINLHDHMLWPPTAIERSYSTVDFGSGQALVHWTDDGIGVRKQNSPLLSWNCKFVSPTPAAISDSPGFRWPWSGDSLDHFGYGSHDYQPWIASVARDINADGIGDLVIAARHQAWVMTISGKDGQILWFAGRGEQLKSPLPTDDQARQMQAHSAVLGDPIATYDCDRDGVNDIIVTMIDLGQIPTVHNGVYSARRWVESISGTSGKTIWSHELPSNLFELDQGANVPYDLRWFPAAVGHSSGGASSMYAFRHITRELRRPLRTGAHAYLPTPAELVTMDGQSRVALLAGTHVVLVDPTTGVAIERPIDTGRRAGKSPRWTDVDGDGSVEVVLLEEVAALKPMDKPQARLVVWSFLQKKELWSIRLGAHWPERVAWTVAPPQWPLAADLNGDGRSEIVVPSGGSWVQPNAASTPSGKITVFSGEDGHYLWERRMPSADQQIDHFIAGPDLDQDGYRELYVVSLSGNPLRVWVDALSGEDGRTCWTGSHLPRAFRDNNAGCVLAPSIWWNGGNDGWPQLIVTVVDETQQPTRSSVVSVFSAADGTVSHFGSNISSIDPADVDGDGIDDLLVFLSKSAMNRDLGGTLHCVRGLAGQAWQRLGQVGEPTADLNGDGMHDLVHSRSDGTLLATSGKSGKRLWDSNALASVEGVGFQVAASELRDSTLGDERFDGDLDRDGTLDLLAWKLSSNGSKVTPFHAVSGRTGRLLWCATEISARVIAATLAAKARDLDGDGFTEVLWLAALDHRYPARSALSSNNVQLWLFVTSGKTGRLKWSRALSPAYGVASRQAAPIYYPNIDVHVTTADLDGDHVEDVIVPALTPRNQVELLALSGKNGKALWSRTRASEGPSQRLLENWVSPTVCDLDADGRLEIVLVEPAPLAEGESEFQEREVQVVSLPARGGNPHWTYRSGVRFARWNTPAGNRADVLRAVALRSGNGQSRVGFYLPGQVGKVVTIDATGQAHERVVARPTHPVPLARCDVDHDGIDEVVFVERSTVLVAPLDQLDRPLWTRTLDTGIEPQLLAIHPATRGGAPVIWVACDGTDNSVLGLDAKSGATLGSCPGPISRDPSDAVFTIPHRIALISDAESSVPLVFYEYGMVAAVRQVAMVPNNEPGRTQMTAKNLRIRAITSTKLPDERWYRDLPWRLREIQASEMWKLVGWSFVFACSLITAPGAYVVRVIRRRRLSLRMLLLLPVLVGWFTLALSVPVSVNDFANANSRLIAAVSFTPVVASAGIVVGLLVRRRWRLVLVWVVVSGLLAVICGAVSLSFASRLAPLLPDERYDWSGWHTIWLFGTYLTAWIMTLHLGIRYTLVPCWKRGQG